MKRVSTSVFGLGVLLILTVAAMKPVNGFSCVEAKLSLLACLPFLTSSQDSPSTACCNAVSNVRASAPTKPELREACLCLTAAVGEVPNLDKDRAVQLPKLCNVDVGFPLTKDIDCNTISL
ncbi:non-specific lipid-transfer protein A-like [Vigna umbellata]|uniref:non-specific lipid-transfer protein A-like n=1 Tax=Vigna umbellata TaxID=87088 RepID=UPI001F5F8461|nr:non-specific lipid-transfer protein A-like [Vigna umbellata]